MSPPQAICHLSDGFRMALGEKAVQPFGSKLVRPVLRIVALHLPMNWPKGVATMPEIEQGVGGTVPEDFENDRAKLLQLIERFGALSQRADWPEHPIFGRMTIQEWGTWGYRHVDHHLRQFHA